VTGLDNGGTFINDMKAMLTAAQQHNIFVFPTLWNGAVNQRTHYRLDGLIRVRLSRKNSGKNDLDFL
jgi:mannan endo-1,4-beta-mannosidase